MASDPTQTAARRPTRFARLYSDGGMVLEAAGVGFLDARQRLCDGHDDPDVELLEVEISVVRSHGNPQLKTVGDAYVTCPTCGEEVHDAEATAEIERLRRELEAAHGLLRDCGVMAAKVVDLKRPGGLA